MDRGGVRRLLRQAALGELGQDLSATADETLIATGLEAGDAEITVYAQEDFEQDLEAVEEPTADEFRVVESPDRSAPHARVMDRRARAVDREPRALARRARPLDQGPRARARHARVLARHARTRSGGHAG